MQRDAASECVGSGCAMAQMASTVYDRGWVADARILLRRSRAGEIVLVGCSGERSARAQNPSALEDTVYIHTFF